MVVSTIKDHFTGPFIEASGTHIINPIAPNENWISTCNKAPAIDGQVAIHPEGIGQCDIP